MRKLIKNLTCPHCNELIEYHFGLAGTEGKCPSCGQSCRMPDSDLAYLKEIWDYLLVTRNAVVVLAVLVFFWFWTQW